MMRRLYYSAIAVLAVLGLLNSAQHAFGASLDPGKLVVTDDSKRLISYGGTAACSSGDFVTALSSAGVATCSTAPASPVQSVFGRIGNVVLLPSDVSTALGYTPATAAQGALADTAVQPATLAAWPGSTNITTLGTIATGSIPYSLLTGTPTLGTMASQNANAVAITGGTISGLASLGVSGSGTFSASVGSSGAVQVSVQNTNPAGEGAISARNDLYYAGLEVFGSAFGNAALRNKALFTAQSGITDFGFATLGAAPISFRTNSSGGTSNTRLQIDSSGRVLSGVTLPTDDGSTGWQHSGSMTVSGSLNSNSMSVTSGLNVGASAAITGALTVQNTTAGNTRNLIVNTNGVAVKQSAYIGWGNATNDGGGTPTLALYWDAANTLAQRNGTNAQTFRVYNTYTDASNYQRLAIQFSSGVAFVSAENAGTGANMPLALSGNGNGIYFYTAGSVRWNISSVGHLLANGSDNAFDIGASTANRPRTGYFGTSVITSLLHGVGSDSNQIRAEETTNGGAATLRLVVSSGTTTIRRFGSTHALANMFGISMDGGTTQHLSIFNSGRVGIGTTTDDGSTLLNVNGSGKFASSLAVFGTTGNPSFLAGNSANGKYFGAGVHFSTGRTFLDAYDAGASAYIPFDFNASIVALNASSGGNTGIGTADQFGSGTKVVGIANATAVPSTNPTGGGVLYAEGGALKWRGSSGTITTIALPYFDRARHVPAAANDDLYAIPNAA